MSVHCNMIRETIKELNDDNTIIIHDTALKMSYNLSKALIYGNNVHKATKRREKLLFKPTDSTSTTTFWLLR